MFTSGLRFPFAALLLTSLINGCGGTSSAVKQPEPEHSAGEPTEEAHSAAAEPSGPDCSDGSCFRCGEGLCLPGFYCDESTQEPTCQWAARCGKSPSCGCIQQLLGSGCHCDVRGGGLFVKCSS